MTHLEFSAQVKRMTSVWGANAFPEERVKIIWREVKDFEARWLAGVVDQFIGNMRQAPLAQDFVNEAAAERERCYQKQKREHKQDAQEFMASDQVRKVVMADYWRKQREGGK